MIGDQKLSEMKNESNRLMQLLRDPSITQDLDNLQEMAVESSDYASPRDEYRAACMAFCDGFEVAIGRVSRVMVLKNLATLKNRIANKLNFLIVRNILPIVRQKGAVLWITLSPETAVLTSKVL